MVASDSTFITRVVLKNYKSIAACDVSLGPLTFLVGPNGSGKSNFVDALRFVSDALSTSLDHAIRERGGINEVLHRSASRPRDFGIRLEFRLGGDAFGHYAFRIESREHGGYKVQDEECVVQPAPEREGSDRDQSGANFRVRDGRAVVESEDLRPAPRDRLYLPIAPREEFWLLARSLAAMGFYNLNPVQIRELQSPDGGASLIRDGSNITSVLSRIARDEIDAVRRIEEYLALMSPRVLGVNVKQLGERETIEFRQLIAGATEPCGFAASGMSDGTLRALGILVALFQSQEEHAHEWAAGVPLVGIEEPETALHPAGAEVLFDALREVSAWRQVLITSHSPDLLDGKEVDSDSILAVVAEAGETQIGPIDDVSRSVVRDRLFSVGDLLRMDQLRPETRDGKPTQPVHLFSDALRERHPDRMHRRGPRR